MTPYNQILEFFNAEKDIDLEKIMELFKSLDNLLEMQDIIERFEKLNENWGPMELKDFITELCGVKWQLKHFQKGQQKNLISPYKHTDYAKIKQDQDSINRKTASQFKTIDLE